jgi:hypothetical protein
LRVKRVKERLRLLLEYLREIIRKERLLLRLVIMRHFFHKERLLLLLVKVRVKEQVEQIFKEQTQ